MKTITNAGPVKLTKGQRLGRDIWRSRELYLFLLPGVILTFIFKYIPIYGIQIAWKKMRLGQSIADAKWIGWDNFERFFNSNQFGDLLSNTLTLNLILLVVTMPIPLIVAIMMHNSRSKKIKAIAQTTTYLPHMVSLVIVVELLNVFINPSHGLINIIRSNLGMDPVNLWDGEDKFIPLYMVATIWSSTGYNVIIYLSALTAIDNSIVEASRIDGASKLQKMWHIDMKLIIPTVVTLLILNMGKILTASSMEKVLLMQNNTNLGVSEIINTYVYKVGIEKSQYGFATAVSVFNSACNILMLFITNGISKKVSKTSLF